MIITMILLAGCVLHMAILYYFISKLNNFINRIDKVIEENNITVKE